MSAADWIGVYGALLATSLAIFEIYKHVLERPRLKVRAYLAGFTIRFVVPGESVRYESDKIATGNEPFLAFRIWNPRRVPVTLSRVGGRTTRGEEFELTYEDVPLPRQLGPGEAIDFAGDPRVVNELFSLDVRDSQGNKWLVPVWNVFIVKVQANAVKVPWIVRQPILMFAHHISRK